MSEKSSDVWVEGNPAPDKKMHSQSVAIIGAGASGLAAAMALNEIGYDVTVIEKNANPGSGGHSSSTEFISQGERHSGNPAFGMFFLSRYPNFHRILQRLDIEIEAIGNLKSSHTTFSLNGKRLWQDAEKIFHSVGIVDEVRRFLQATRDIIQNTKYDTITAQQYFTEHGYSENFIHYYFLGHVVLFFGGQPISYYLQYPIRLLIAGKYSAFLDPSLREETIYRIKHGTGHYITIWKNYLAKHGVNFYFSTIPQIISRNAQGVTLALQQNSQPLQQLQCHYLIISTLPDTALNILGDTATPQEQEILSAFPITHDTAILHTDKRFMPSDPTTWRYGNHIIPDDDEALTLQHPYMFTANILCNYDRSTNVFCTYAYQQQLDISHGHRVTNRHVQVTPQTLQLREQLTALQGRENIWFIGSWTKNLTLHEDAIVSGLEAANAIAGKQAFTIAAEPHLALLAAATNPWNKHATFIDVLTTQVHQYQHKVVFIFVDNNGNQVDSITYQELYQYARNVAYQLVNKWHTKPGERVLLCYKQGIDFIATFLGCLIAGIIPVPLPPMDPARIKSELDKFSALVTDSGAKMVLTDKYYYKYYLLSRLLSISLYFKSIHARWRTTDSLRDKTPRRFVSPSIATNQLAYLQYTSGSTAMPKGVMVSHENLLAQLAMLKTTFQFDDKVVGSYWIPQFHSFSLVSCILLPIYVGATTIILSPLTFLKNPHVFANCLSHYQVTLTAMPAFGLHHLLEKTTYRQREQWDWSHLSKIMIGAEPIDAQLLDKFVKAFAVTGLKDNVLQPAYGMTEHVLGITLGGTRYYHIDKEMLQLHRHIYAGEHPLVGCGQPPPNVTVKIVDLDNQQVLGEDEVGEIWINSPSKALGYWQQPQATQETFYASLPEDTSGQKFLRSGDLGFFHQGELFVCGRVKEIIIIRGHNLFPMDIGRAIFRNLPANCISGCVPIGTTFNAEVGEELVIILELSKLADKAVYEDIVQRTRNAVINTVGVAPRNVVLVKPGSVPRTRTGKLRHTPCKLAYSQGELPIVYEDVAQTHIIPLPKKSDQSITDTIVLALKNITRQTIDIHKPLNQQVSLDSLQVAELISGLSTQLSIDIPLSALINHQSIQSLASYIATLPKNATLHPALVLLNAATKPKQIPLFLVHPARGNIQCFLELAKVWDYPMYALQQPTHYDSLEEMAADYLSIIKTVQPNGPYFIGGYSFGASVSLEITQQLLARDDRVIATLLIDELHAATAEISISGKFTATELFLQVARDYVDESSYLKLVEMAKSLPDEMDQLPNLAQHIPNNRLAQQALHETKIYHSNLQLLAKYNEKPTKLPIVPIALFKSTGSFNKNILYYNKVAEISGTHLTLLTPPHVNQLAKEVKAWVDTIIKD